MKTNLYFIYCFFILCFTAKSQNVLQPDVITNSLQAANIAKIVFLRNAIPLEQLKESDFLETFPIKKESNLYIRIFMGNSLTNYLHQLNTSLSAEELIKNGNFQFTFYVDNKLLYTENLNLGAGTPQIKNKSTTIQLPFFSTLQEESWGRFLWSRFYYGNGGEDALFIGTHVLKIEIRPYLKTDGKTKTGSIIAEGSLKIEAAKIEINENQVSIQKIAPQSEWKNSQNAYDTIVIRELNKRIEEKRFKNITSIAVIKNGELLLEEYFNGADRNTLHDTRSVGKSFASTMMGIAIKEDYIKNENASLNQFYDLKKYKNYSIEKEQVTLKSLLTMSSAFDGSDQNADSPGNEENMYPTSDWVKFGLDLPMDSTKQIGKNWDYFTAGVVILGDIIHKQVPNGLEAYAEKKLFSPLGIKNYKWKYTPQKVANTAGGLGLQTLDLAKYGQLYQNKGTWNGKRILSKDWIEKSFTNYFPQNENLTGYGYLFWKDIFTVNEKKYEAFGCSGNGGNKVYVFKDIPLVIVITATAYNKPYAHPQVFRMMQEFILPAVIKP
ncbi:serine hydrolase domain-containing protein [Flavobacterium hungaricum]|uniref:Class C beta-lactamase-related serine hydrolase n=1 Tax=Flavobacterium hungaricum TaxID=2082725 RepID=A0ABR9TSC7_9FLAO|nr:serine hydrolase [Flavobacterium hungaricum]MBE8728243.1 class C beta-lactamase-related serine hydrolase [Flavobacterium hungaricum]